MAKKTTQKNNSKTSKKLTLDEIVESIHACHDIIGRNLEIRQLATSIGAQKNVLIEGPVGVGKTVLAAAVAATLGKKVIRIDGDSRFTEQKLTGWFDPALVLKKGYTKNTFVPGPLVEAMMSGSILFINELNRMPEAVQNVLLPAIDEGVVQIPQLGTVEAKEGFLVVATQNPREFVATSHLSEALMDRMEWVQLHYQTFEEEKTIAKKVSGFDQEPYVSWAVGIVRLTREHAKIKRGASIRAAIAILQLLKSKLAMSGKGMINELDFAEAAKLALTTRIELNTGELDGTFDQQIQAILNELTDSVKKNF